MSREQIPDADLDWLAFQYAADELQGVELEAFETLLATDERACAALARAVMLGQAVVQCEQLAEVVTQRTPSIAPVGVLGRRSFTRRVIAFATLASSLLFVGWLFQRTAREDVPKSNETASAVATLWIEGADENVVAEAVLPDHVAAGLVEDEPVPGWLLAALNEQQRAGDDDELIMND